MFIHAQLPGRLPRTAFLNIIIRCGTNSTFFALKNLTAGVIGWSILCCQLSLISFALATSLYRKHVTK